MPHPKTRKIPKWLPALCVALVPALIQVIWLLHNTQLPISDAAAPLERSYFIAQYAFHHQWSEFIHALYKMREWRPIALYLVEVPFQLLAGGNLMLAAAGLTLFCTFISTLYIYRLLRLTLDAGPSALGAVLLGLTPLVQWPSAYFAFSETVFLPAVLATLYHLVRSRDLQDARHSSYFVLAAFVAFIMRPIESLTHLAPIFILFMALGWKKKIMSFGQIYAVACVVMTSVTVLILAAWFHHGFDPHSGIFLVPERAKIFTQIGMVAFALTGVLFLGLFGSLAYVHWWSRSRPPYLLQAFSGLCLLTVLYYWKFVSNLVEWVYECSLSKDATGIIKPPFYEIIRSYILGAGLLPFAVVSLLGLTSFFFCITKEQRKQLLHQPLLYLVALLPVPLILALFTVQFTQRKVTTALCVLFILLIIPALMKGRVWYLRLGVLALVATWQLAGLVWIYSAHTQTVALGYTVGASDLARSSAEAPRGAFPDLVTIKPNPHDTVANYIVDNAARHGFKHIILPVIGTNSRTVDPLLVSNLVTARNPEVDAFFPHYLAEVYTQQSIPEFFKSTGADALLIVADEPAIAPAQDIARFNALRDATWIVNDKLAYDLLALQASGKIEKTAGIKKIECTIIASTSIQMCMYAIPHKNLTIDSRKNDDPGNN